jgi:hypothetical protein
LLRIWQNEAKILNFFKAHGRTSIRSTEQFRKSLQFIRHARLFAPPGAAGNGDCHCCAQRAPSRTGVASANSRIKSIRGSTKAAVIGIEQWSSVTSLKLTRRRPAGNSETPSSRSPGRAASLPRPCRAVRRPRALPTNWASAWSPRPSRSSRALARPAVPRWRSPMSIS